MNVATTFSFLVVLASSAVAQSTERISVGPGDVQLNFGTGAPSISGEGRFVVFSSTDAALALDANGLAQVYARDRDPDGNGVFDEGNATTTMISRAANGQPGNGASGQSAISDDGRWVAFTTGANNFTTHFWSAGASYLLDRDSDQNGIYDELPNAYHAMRALSNAAPNSSLGDFDITASGSYVGFTTSASNMVPSDNNGQSDVFRWERATGLVVRCNVSGAGVQANAISGNGTISDDGRLVAFQTQATNLLAAPTAPGELVLVRDILAGTTTPVSISTSGVLANNLSLLPDISGDGLFVAFTTYASNFDPIDTDFFPDIYVRDLFGSTTTLISVDSLGNKATQGSTEPYISSDGERICFRSLATNLYWNDVSTWDVFVHDRTEGWTRQVSKASDGTHANGPSAEFAGFDFAAGGGSATFTSVASNLVANDTNGIMDIFAHDLCPTGGDELGGVLIGYMGLSPEIFACGELSTGSQATVTIFNASPLSRGGLFATTTPGATPLHGGTLLAGANSGVSLFFTDSQGRAQIVIPGGGGPGTLYVHVLVRDNNAVQNVAFSNALALPLLP